MARDGMDILELLRKRGLDGDVDFLREALAVLDEVVEKFLSRPPDGGQYAYLWLDALTQKVRGDGKIVSMSAEVGTAVNAEGKREIVGLDVGTSEDGAFWLSFLRSLVARGLVALSHALYDQII